MKLFRIVLFLLLLAVLGAAAQTGHQGYVQKSPNKIVVTTQLSQKLLAQIASGDAYLVDVRTAEEYKGSHLKYAKNIDIKSADFGTEISKLNKNKRVYLYCRSGSRSGKATDTLQTFGYKRGYNIGGLDSLAKSGFPLENGH
ncbi:phage shock protein E [Pedobacter cryoconitis]|uniref:rhodanese-like domain-containing protein n=1 Tax=Pedobacter cryoconitis TaxID=188932 RepID=UPI00161AD376|nr:rhodanese-like domain-containing protein [Pedobacter cryoconitis]MBB6273986.1 phage shock protein E [Pedobacter cryoconitis]